MAPKFVTEFQAENTNRAAQVAALKARSTEHLLKASGLLDRCNDAASAQLSALVSAELASRPAVFAGMDGEFAVFRNVQL